MFFTIFISIICIVALIFFAMIVSIFFQKQRGKNSAEKNAPILRDMIAAKFEKERSDYINQRLARAEKFGIPSYTELYDLYNTSIEAYEGTKTLYFNYCGEEHTIEFSKIISVDFNADGVRASSTTTTTGYTKTGTGNAVGRSVVGGLVGGGVGAVIGGTTSKRNINQKSETEYRQTTSYAMTITLDDLANPNIFFKGSSSMNVEFMRKLSSIITVIINRKESKAEAKEDNSVNISQQLETLNNTVPHKSVNYSLCKQKIEEWAVNKQRGLRQCSWLTGKTREEIAPFINSL